MASFTRRIVETARLKPLAYEEVEADVRERTWWHAPAAVTLASIGMGAAQLGFVTPRSAFYSIVLGFAGWLLWSGIAFVVGVQLLPSRTTYATWGQLLRTTAFATGPGILGFVGLIRELTGFAAAVLGVWILVAGVVAVKHALDYSSTLRAFAVCIIGWGINFALAWAMAS